MARILVTGCSSGIGRATAELLSARGHHVIATARDRTKLDDLPVAARLGLDVTDPASVAATLDEAGEIDVLINNAGQAMWGPLELCDFDQIDAVFATNLLGAVRMTKAVLPQMRTRRSGRIIQISSGAARRPQGLVGVYCASKAALETLSMALRIEMRDFNVKVAIVGMGAVRSSIDQNRFIADARGTEYEAVMDSLLARVGRMRDQANPTVEAAHTILSVVEAQDPAFRTYVGEAFGEELAQVAALSDRDYEERFLRVLHAA